MPSSSAEEGGRTLNGKREREGFKRGGEGGGEREKEESKKEKILTDILCCFKPFHVRHG